MSECTRFMQAEEMQAQGALYGAAMAAWQEHARGCATCAAQQAAATDLRAALASEPAPRVPREFAKSVLRRVRAEETARAQAERRLPRRAAWLLALNWICVAAVCTALAAMIRPAGGDYRSVSFMLPVAFVAVAGAVAALSAARSRQPLRSP